MSKKTVKKATANVEESSDVGEKVEQITGSTETMDLPREGVQLGPEDMEPVPENVPNVIYVGKQTRLGKVVNSPAPTWRRSGSIVFDDLPDDATQRAGFYYPRATELIKAFPQAFKRFIKKGDPS